MKKITLALIALVVLSTTACKKDQLATPKKAYDQKDNTGWDVDGDGDDTNP